MKTSKSFLYIEDVWKPLLVLSDVQPIAEPENGVFVDHHDNYDYVYYTDGVYKTVEENGTHYMWLIIGSEVILQRAIDQEPVTLEDYRAAKIGTSKTQLADYLEAHPLTYSDGKQYSVTAEKQSLLTSALARHQIATAAGVQTALKWNATGEECTVWEYADLAALALAIAAYVEPLVGQQQAAEVAINACSTVAEVEAIVIAYGS